MCTTTTTTNESISFTHTTGAERTLGTSVTVPDSMAKGNVYNSLSVINDSDQDIKVSYLTAQGVRGEFIVPKSIKGFTRTLSVTTYDNHNVKVYSISSTADAIGNIHFNFCN